MDYFYNFYRSGRGVYVWILSFDTISTESYTLIDQEN